MKSALRAWVSFFCGFISALVCAAEPQWHQEAGFRWADLALPTGGKTGFKLLLPHDTGVNFTNTLEVRAGATNRVLHNGSGLAIGDYNNDRRPDLYFCSLNGRNALYQNLGGWRFKEISDGAGIVCSNQFCRGAVFADLNGDSHLDVLVATTGEGVLCFLNDGHGRFADVTATAGTASRYGMVTLALADVDGNGTLDLYVASNRTDDIRDRGEVDVGMVNGRIIIPPSLTNRLVVLNGKVQEYGEPDFLYLNDGKGRFTAVSWTDGAFLDEEGKKLTGPPLDWGLTATFRDLNGDGQPDLHVCNDYWTPDRVWMNLGEGRFRAADKLAFRESCFSSMGVDMADLTRSGNVDVFVADMLSRSRSLRKRQVFAHPPMASPLGAIDNRQPIMHNALYRNRGDGTYEEIANYAGLPASDWSWSPQFLDVDLDGYEDLLIAAGYSRDTQDLDAEAQIRGRRHLRMQMLQIADPKARWEAFIQGKMENARLYPPLDMPVIAFRNLGNYRFEEVTAQWGTDQPGVHHAQAMADLDGDGDLDLIVNNLGSAAGVYRNESSAPRVAVRLKGQSPNTQGIGAKVTLRGASVPMQRQEVVAGGHYLAGSDVELVFAAGQIKDGMTLEVLWRNGRRSVIKDVRVNRRYEIDEAGSVDYAQLAKPQPKPLFEDVSPLLNHVHQEIEFNDFERQPGLPRKLSQSGPGVAWGDVDGDGWDDLVIGSGKGGALAIYANTGQGSFKRLTDSVLETPTALDHTGLLIWRDGSKSARVLAGLANYESGLSTASRILIYDPSAKAFVENLAIEEASIGALAMADMDGDGGLELFAAGRVLAGRYPEAATSRIYRRQAGGWTLDQQNAAALAKVGLVSGATWSDLDGDGFSELLLACEWGPIKIFRNDRGRLTAWDAPITATNQQPSTLSRLTGWWNGVATGDLDGDGRLDIIVSNWGLNTPYRASLEHPALIYAGDFAGVGTLNLIEAEYDPAVKTHIPRGMRDKVAEALPELLGRFPTYKSYGEASLTEVLGNQRAAAREARAACLAVMLFLNRGNHFEALALPDAAQLSPAFSLSIADFDGDGQEDVFLSQNFFANQPEVPRYDAGRGLLLRGDGSGQLRAMPGQESGIKVYGEQRGAAVADFDGDGRVDLAVTQNAAATRLFRNVKAKPGLRVRLNGPAGNPTGVGAQMRLHFGQRSGPMREIHAGSGYLSQNSAVQVLAIPEPPTEVWVRWPGGKVTTGAVPKDVKEIVVSFDGTVTASR